MNGKDELGLKMEKKLGQLFQFLMPCLKWMAKILLVSATWWNLFDIFFITCVQVKAKSTRIEGLVKKYRGGGGGWAGAFGNAVDKKHMTQPLPSAQKWLTHP